MIQVFNHPPNLLKTCDNICKLKICYTSICEPTTPSTWWAKKETRGNYTMCFSHDCKGFSISISCTNSCWNKCNSVFKVDMITLAFDTISPKNESWSFFVMGSTCALTRFKYKYAYNKKGHTILISYSTKI